MLYLILSNIKHLFDRLMGQIKGEKVANFLIYMGSTQSSEFVEPPQIISLLGSKDIVESSKYWSQLFSYKFSNAHLPKLQSFIADLYSKKPYNFHLSIKICGIRLKDNIQKNGIDNNNADQIQAIIVFLRAALPVIVSSGCHVAVLNQFINDNDKLGSFLSTTLIQLLHFKELTTNKNDEHWYQDQEDDTILNYNRLNIVEILIILKTIGVAFQDFDHQILVKSISAMLSFYLSSASRKSLTTIQKLLQSSILFLLLLKIDLVSEDTIRMYHSLTNDSEKKFYQEENNTFILPLVYSLLSIAAKDDAIIDSSGLPLIINTLYLCDQIKDGSSLNALALILSFPSTSIALNAACISFESSVPVHRGSYADIVIEIVTRQSMSLLKPIVMVIVNVIPYASNLSYGSAISIFKILTAALTQKDHESVKMIVSAIHYTVNRSVRDNIPLVILVMKNSKILITINKEYENFEECDQLVSFVKNVNQELKQIGAIFQSSELEKFFNDPSCEHFALPVLRPPQIDFDLEKEIEKQAKNMTALYVINQIGVQPKSKKESL